MDTDIPRWPATDKYAPNEAPRYTICLLFLAYGRVANLKSDSKQGKDDRGQGQLVDHYTSLMLATFVDAGLLEVGGILWWFAQEQFWNSLTDPFRF